MDSIRLIVGLTVTFGAVFVGLTAAFYFMTDRKFWKSVGCVALVYLICAIFVFFITYMVSWSFNVPMWEVIT